MFRFYSCGRAVGAESTGSPFCAPRKPVPIPPTRVLGIGIPAAEFRLAGVLAIGVPGTPTTHPKASRRLRWRGAEDSDITDKTCPQMTLEGRAQAGKHQPKLFCPCGRGGSHHEESAGRVERLRNGMFSIGIAHNLRPQTMDAGALDRSAPRLVGNNRGPSAGQGPRIPLIRGRSGISARSTPTSARCARDGTLARWQFARSGPQPREDSAGSIRKRTRRCLILCGHWVTLTQKQVGLPVHVGYPTFPPAME
jgi:hypothetical protein